MVRKTLTDYTIQKNTIVHLLGIKQSRNMFNQNQHDIFNSGSGKLEINDVKIIIESIEYKLREVEIIYYTFFDSEYDKNILLQSSLISPKFIETEFTLNTQVLKSTIEIHDPSMYREIIHMKFQSYILTIASLYENLVRLIETLLKKRVVYGDRNPHQSIPFNTLISYWDNLIELDYRKNDIFYVWLCNHRPYLSKYLKQINTLRNSFIHGYVQNLEIEPISAEYVIKNHDTANFNLASGGIVPDLVLNSFVKEVLSNTQNLVKEILEIFQKKLSHHNTKVPI